MDTLPTSKNIADFTGRVWHSDCLDLLKALPDKSVDMVLVDLPYGVTAYEWDNVIPFEPMWQAIKRIAKKKAAVVMTATEPFASRLRMSNEAGYRYDWIIRKSNATRFLDANRMPLLEHEIALVFGEMLPSYYPQFEIGTAYHSRRDGKIPYAFDKDVTRINTDNSGTRYPRTILDFPMAQEGKLHPNQKPLDLFEYLIRTYTQAGEIVLDFCSGSATTAIACLNLDRQYICGDSHLPYVELSRQRIASHDPFQDTPLKNGMKQKSLFASTEGEGA